MWPFLPDSYRNEIDLMSWCKSINFLRNLKCDLLYFHSKFCGGLTTEPSLLKFYMKKW